MTAADELPETVRPTAPERESAAAQVGAENLRAIVEEAYRPQRSRKVDQFPGDAARHPTRAWS